MSSVFNVLTPLGDFDIAATYVAQTIFGGTGAAPLYVSCPTVSSAGGVYFATGFDRVSGLPKQPTVGVLPATDTAWTILSQGDGSGSVTSVTVENGNVTNPTTTPVIQSVGNGDVALIPTQVSFVPTLTSSAPGDLSVTYTTQTGNLNIIGNTAFINFNLECSFTNTTGTGPIQLFAPEIASLPTADYVRSAMEYIIKSSTLHAAGYTQYVSYMNGGQIWAEAQTTDPTLLNVPVQLQDITDSSSFKMHGQIVVRLS